MGWLLLVIVLFFLVLGEFQGVYQQCIMWKKIGVVKYIEFRWLSMLLWFLIMCFQFLILWLCLIVDIIRLLKKFSRLISSVISVVCQRLNGVIYYSEVLMVVVRVMLLMKFLMVFDGDRLGVILCLLNSLLQMYCIMLESCMMIIRQVISSRLCFLKLGMLRVSSVGMKEIQNIVSIRFYCIFEVCLRKCLVLLFSEVRIGNSRNMYIGMKIENMLYQLMQISRYCIGSMKQNVVISVGQLLCWVGVRVMNLCRVQNDMLQNSRIIVVWLSQKVKLIIRIIVYQVLICVFRLLIIVFGLGLVCYLRMKLISEVSSSSVLILLKSIQVCLFILGFFFWCQVQQGYVCLFEECFFVFFCCGDQWFVEVQGVEQW